MNKERRCNLKPYWSYCNSQLNARHTWQRCYCGLRCYIEKRGVIANRSVKDDSQTSEVSLRIWVLKTRVASLCREMLVRREKTKVISEKNCHWEERYHTLFRWIFLLFFDLFSSWMMTAGRENISLISDTNENISLEMDSSPCCYWCHCKWTRDGVIVNEC